MHGYKTKYKDCNPLQTVDRIRNILNGLDLLAEERWMYQVEGCYSVTVFIFGTALLSNGKGTTPEYALASAYAELMERMQNFHLQNINLDAGGDVMQYRGFNFAPDERRLSVEEVLECGDDWARVFTFKAENRDEKMDILKKWLIEDNTGKPSDFTSVPFLNIIDGKLHYLPRVMQYSLYGSNGMCAGNTPEEAIVQGLSEIFERNMHGVMVRKGITPPTIPHSYIKQYPEVYELLKRIEQKGNFKIIVKDCSLGEGFPVVAIIFADVDRQTYTVRFGAHPVFEIALERCMTELLQGVNFKDMYWTSKFSYFNKDVGTSKNYMRHVSAGRGYYAAGFFDENFSYPFKGFDSPKAYDNKFMARYLCNLLQEKGYDILVRDVSFLGFSSYYIVVPFFSEIADLSVKTIENFSRAVRVKRTARNLKRSTDEELQEIIDYMYNGENEDFSYKSSITRVLGLSLTNEFPWHGLTRDIFAASAYYRMGQLSKAYEIMDGYIHNIETGEKSPEITYYKCVRDYFGMRSDGIEDEGRIKKLLGVFYPENIICKVIDDLKNPDEVFRKCEGLKCFNCSECEWQKCCLYPKVRKIHMQLKDRYAKNVIDQHRVNNVLQNMNMF